MELIVKWWRNYESGESDGYIAVGEMVIPIGYENARKLIDAICRNVKLEFVDENPHESIYASRDDKVERRVFSSALMDAEVLSISL